MASKKKENWDYRTALNPDDIPSIQNPRFTREYKQGKETDTMIVLEGTKETRAYPLRVLDFHEIVNDTFDGTPVTITWCPLCGSAIVFDRRIKHGDKEMTLTLGVRGALANDDMVMFDHETKSLWKQSMGECFEGELGGKSLEMFPSTVMSWKRYKQEFPEGLVVDPPGGKSEAGSADSTPVEIDYRDEPYREYLESERFFGVDGKHGKQSRKWNRDDVKPKEEVIGIQIGGKAMGFPREQVRKAGGIVNETVAGNNVVIVDTSEGLQAFWRTSSDSFTKKADDPDAIVHSGDKSKAWNAITGKSITAGDGNALKYFPCKRIFAFAWQDDNGTDSFWFPR